MHRRQHVVSLAPIALLALLTPLAMVAAGQSPLPLKHAPQRTGPAITAADLMTRLYIFADDSLQGREAGTIGNVKATDYIAREAERMGLVPAGEGGTYFQTIPLKTRTFDTTSTFTVAGTALAPFRDYVPLAREAVESPALPIVYGGEVRDTAHLVTPDQARGKLVVLDVRGGVGGLRPLRGAPRIKGAAAVALVALDSLPPPLLGFFRRPQSFLDDTPAATERPVPVLLIGRGAVAQMFATPLEQLTPGAAGTTAALSIRYAVAPAPYPARNVVAVVPGSDPKVKGEYVAIGGHNDHLGFAQAPVDHDSIRIWNHIVRPEGADDAAKRATPALQARVDSTLAAFRARHSVAPRPDSIANGADDDGSGSVAVLEVAEKIASLKQKPKRSILFVWHTAEEKGLLGSRYFTDHPTVPRDSIVAQLNMDMVGCGSAADETGRTKDSVPLHGSPSYV